MAGRARTDRAGAGGRKVHRAAAPNSTLVTLGGLRGASTPERLGILAGAARDSDRDVGLLRAGVAIGFSALAAGALLIVASVRSQGLGVAPTIAQNPLHLGARLQVVPGCAAIILGVLWASVRTSAPPIRRLRPYVIAALALCVVSPVLTVTLNAAIVSGYVPDHFALLPTFADLGVALLYIAVVHPLSGMTQVGLSARLMLRSSYLWLIGAAVGEFAWVVKRVLLDSPQAWRSLERAGLEVGLLGFVALGGLGLMMTALPVVSLSRSLIQTLLRTYQITNALIFAWGALQIWSLRYPGSLESLALSLIGTGILICIIIITANSGLFQRWQRMDEKASSEDWWEFAFASVALALLMLGGVLFATSAMVGVRHPPPEALLAAALLALALGMLPVVAIGVVVELRGALEPMGKIGLGVLLAGILGGVVLRPTSLLVERSLVWAVASAEALATLGLLILVLGVQLMREQAEQRDG